MFDLDNRIAETSDLCASKPVPSASPVPSLSTSPPKSLESRRRHLNSPYTSTEQPGSQPFVGSKPTSLLNLPAEIRQLILEELLWRPQCDGPLPLFLDPITPRLYPAILGTCKQLYTEGLGLLYSSTVHFDVRRNSRPFLAVPCGDVSYGYRVIYLGRMFTGSRQLPLAVRQRTSKVNIQIRAHKTDGVFRQDDIQEVVRDLTRSMLKPTPNWQHFRLQAHTFLGGPLHQAPDRKPLHLQPFLPLTYLRNRSSVTYNNSDIDADFANILEQKITTTTTTITSKTNTNTHTHTHIEPNDLADLDSLYDTFHALLLRTLPPAPARHFQQRRTETEFLLIRACQEGEELRHLLETGPCKLARDYGDVPRFLEGRNILVRKLSDCVRERQRTFSLPIGLSDPEAVLGVLEGLLV